MSNLSQNQSSPFDSIRHVDEQGNEFWYARELMPMLGYIRWERVPEVVEKAKTACLNGGSPVSQHFSEEARKTGGRDGQDYKLSRHGCYLVAMNGDPRKLEIASAQSYFAVKTHQAESVDLATQQLNQLLTQNLLTLTSLCQQQGTQIQSLTSQLSLVQAQVSKIEATQQEAIASLDETAEPEVEAEELTTRAKLNRLVRDYSAANAVHFHEVWRRVYREFRDRYHVDLKQRAKNIQANGGKKSTSLDVCEQLGHMEQLYAVAFELLKA